MRQRARDRERERERERDQLAGVGAVVALATHQSKQEEHCGAVARQRSSHHLEGEGSNKFECICCRNKLQAHSGQSVMKRCLNLELNL